MKERFKCYRTKKELALDKIAKIDKMAKFKPREHASECFKRAPYSVWR